MAGFSFSDEYGAWVRVSYYEHPDPLMPSITLLPMIHIGEPDYFRAIHEETLCHNTVYLEGAYAPGKRSLHLAHRSVGFFSSLSLQSGKVPFFRKWKKEEKNSGEHHLTEWTKSSQCDCGKCYAFNIRYVRADLHRSHAIKALKKVPIWGILSFPFILLAMAACAPFMNFRKMSVEDDIHDNEKDEDFILKRLFKPFWKFIIDDRDLFLRMVLAEEIIDPKNARKKLCVKYGAKHMPALAETLLKDFDYELKSQRDVLAIKASKDLDVSDIETGYDYAFKKLWGETSKRKSSTTDLPTITLDDTQKYNSFSLTTKPIIYQKNEYFSLKTRPLKTIKKSSELWDEKLEKLTTKHKQPFGYKALDPENDWAEISETLNLKYQIKIDFNAEGYPIPLTPSNAA